MLHHFTSKEKLLEAVLDIAEANRDHEFQRAGTKGREALLYLVELLDRLEQAHQLNSLFSVLQLESLQERHPARERVVQRNQCVVEMISGCLGAIAAEGGLKPGVDPDCAARILLSMVDSLSVYRRLGGAVSVSQDVREFLTMILVEPLDEFGPTQVDGPDHQSNER
ncbi:TetR/AcrR family transcriptional regulator [Devriesea agamarum]|uniref:TetR/AcrR family transcriptional regulator n=1 Tax=Devriesea agamarum TaxID=472569 RepID=UPI00071C51E9